MYEDKTSWVASREERQRADISSPEAVERIWKDARQQAEEESGDRERRAARGRKLPFGFSRDLD